VYLNKNLKTPFTESDALGGSDPYSASKSIADIATQSWVASFKGQPTVIARAGNVIGGGDFNEERLIPELVSSFLENKPPVVRYPNMIRPWQHVLDCLDGYYKLIKQTVDDVNLDGTIWNFGPEPKNHIKVSEVAEIVSKKLSSNISWINDVNYNPPESEKLFLDSSKAVKQLRWNNRLNVEEALEMTVNWYRDLKNGESAKFLVDRDIKNFYDI
jgi:CDP-glucose 4,6-dehydratase